MNKIIIVTLFSLVLLIYPVYSMEHSSTSNIFALDTRNIPQASMQHWAVSNIFTLDTRDISWGMSHSAVSNIFTLDTRDAAYPLKIVSISPDPNPKISQVMEGGIAYRYYRLVDKNGQPAKGIIPIRMLYLKGALLSKAGNSRWKAMRSIQKAIKPTAL